MYLLTKPIQHMLGGNTGKLSRVTKMSELKPSVTGRNDQLIKTAKSSFS